MNNIHDKHVPLNKIAIYKLKFKTKLWITTALQKHSSTNNRIFKNYTLTKDIYQKNKLHNNYKIYRNLVFTLKYY